MEATLLHQSAVQARKRGRLEASTFLSHEDVDALINSLDRFCRTLGTLPVSLTPPQHIILHPYHLCNMPSSSRCSLSILSLPETTRDKGAHATTKTRRRSNSIATTLRKLLPSNKAERGGTLRKRGYHGSLDDASITIPITTSNMSLRQGNRDEKLVRWNTPIDLSSHVAQSDTLSSSAAQSQQLYLERREKRRQRRSLKESGDYLGVQGVNPRTGEMDVLTPSSSSASSPFASLTQAVQDKRSAYESARRALRSEKMRKWEMDKAALRAERRGKVR